MASTNRETLEITWTGGGFAGATHLHEERVQSLPSDNGSEMKALVVQALGLVRVAAATNLATSIQALTVSPAAGWVTGARRTISIRYADSGFSVEVRMRDSSGSDVLSTGYGTAAFADLKGGVAYGIEQLGHPVFADQVRNLP